MSTAHINHIKVGERVRQDLGDLTDLMASISKVGLLQPIVVDKDMNLVAGARRLEACRKLDFPTVKVVVATRVSDALTALVAERDENECRKPFTPSEMVELGRRLEELERPRAEERSRANLRHGNLPPRGDRPAPEGKPTTEKVAQALGTSRRTYEKAKAVVEAAEADGPAAEVARVAKAGMDATGKVDPAFQQVRKAQAVLDGDAETQRAADRADLQGLLRKFNAVANTLLAYQPDAIASMADAGTRHSLDEAARCAHLVGELISNTRHPRSIP